MIFYPTVDGKNVYGIFRTTVGIGEGGKTVYFSKQSFEPKAGGEVKLKSIDEVKQSISKVSLFQTQQELPALPL